MNVRADLTAPRALDRLAVFADPLVRVTVGLLLIPHGAQKLFGWFGGFGLTATGQYFDTTLGMRPGLVFATLAALVEFFGGLALVLGILTRPAALAVVVFMAVALSTHVPNGFFWTEGGFEYPLMWGLIALAVFLRGPTPIRSTPDFAGAGSDLDGTEESANDGE